MNNSGPGIRARLGAALRDALKARDQAAAAALRSALGAIGNAEAVPGGPAAPGAATSQHIAGARAGLGAGEAGRRAVGEAEARKIVDDEAAERIAAAQEYERAGQAGRATRLRREADVLAAALRDEGQGP